MINTDRLKGAIVSAGMTQKEVYEKMGLTARQWQIRMDAKKMDSDEMYKILDIVPIGDDLMSIFFAPNNT